MKKITYPGFTWADALNKPVEEMNYMELCSELKAFISKNSFTKLNERTNSKKNIAK